MIYELSRDYDRAWQLIQQGEKLACHLIDEHRPIIAFAFYQENYEATKITDNEWNYLDMLEDNNFDDFAKRSTELSAEFYLPLADNMIVVSSEKLKEIASEVATKSLAPFDKLIKTMGGLTP
jgi:hypothetical protein